MDLAWVSWGVGAIANRRPGAVITVFSCCVEYLLKCRVPTDVKSTLQRLVLAVTLVTTASSCTTAYDAYGRPYDAVDPGTALLGAAAVGLVAYGLASSNDHHHRSYRRDDCYTPSYRHSSYYGGHSGYGYGRGYGRDYCRY